MAVTPGSAFAQGPIEQSDDLPYEEEMAPIYNNTIFHTDQGTDYRSDGGTGVDTDSDFHSDDQSQSATVSETVVDNVAVKVTQSYDQLTDKQVSDYSAGSDSGSTAVNYTRDQENYDVSATVVVGGETVVSQATPTVKIMTGYQAYNAVFGSR